MEYRPLAEELGIVQELAQGAGRLILNYYQSGIQVELKADKSPVTIADLEANAFIVKGLKSAFPSDRILSEEGPLPELSPDTPRTWCVDPLDGTREFLAHNGEFSVMIGLAVKGEAVLGVLYQPTEDLLVWGSNGSAGGRKGGLSIKVGVSACDRLADARVVVSRRRNPPLKESVQSKLSGAHLCPVGGMGIKVIRIATGEADLYLGESDLAKEWDTCAPEAVLRAAGGLMTDGFGRPLRYNKSPPTTPFGWVASNGLLHGGGIEAVRSSLENRTT